jgi:predicted DNA-binding ribbon-helix-helix protein
MRFAQGCNDGPISQANLYAMRTRSIRIHGVVTSVGLENACWDVLLSIACQNNLTINQQLCCLHDDYLSGRHRAANFCSFLRVFCMQYLSGHSPKFQISAVRNDPNEFVTGAR